MKGLKNKTVVIAFTNGTMDTCIVLDIDYKLRFIKLCYADDPETAFWRNLNEITSINLQVASSDSFPGITRRNRRAIAERLEELEDLD